MSKKIEFNIQFYFAESKSQKSVAEKKSEMIKDNVLFFYFAKIQKLT